MFPSKLENVWTKYILTFFGLFILVHGIKRLFLAGSGTIGYLHTLLGFGVIMAGTRINLEKEESFKIFLSFLISFFIAAGFMLVFNNFHIY